MIKQLLIPSSDYYILNELLLLYNNEKINQGHIVHN